MKLWEFLLRKQKPMNFKNHPQLAHHSFIENIQIIQKSFKNMLYMMSTIVCYHLKGMFDSRKKHKLGNVLAMFSLRTERDVMGSPQTMNLRYCQIQKSQGFKQEDLGGQAVGNCRMLILSQQNGCGVVFHATGDMWRNIILHKKFSFIASPCLKSQNNRLL